MTRRRPTYPPPVANKDVFWGARRRQWRNFRIDNMHSFKRRMRKALREFCCWSGFWHDEERETFRYRQLAIDVTTCRACYKYLGSGPIYTEVQYNQEVPFEGFKIESIQNNSDPASAFYRPPIDIGSEDGPPTTPAANQKSEVTNS